MIFAFQGVTEGVNTELAVSQEDKFKVPEGKIVIKSETAEAEKSKTLSEDKIETDGIVTNATTKSETEQVRLAFFCPIRCLCDISLTYELILLASTHWSFNTCIRKLKLLKS